MKLRDRLLATLGGGLVALLAACQTTPDDSPCLLANHTAADVPCRPYRVGMVKMNPEKDQTKPLAPMDDAGWVLVNRLMVGAPSADWLGGFTLETFEPRWWFELPTAVSAPIAAFGEHVVVGLRDGRVMKLNGATGEKLWEQQLGRFVARPMVLAGSTLLAVNVDQKLFALDFKTGDRRWVFDAGRPGNLVLQGGAPPAVSGRTVYFGSANGELFALDLASGQQRWKYAPKFSEFRFKDIIGELALANNLLVAARYDGKVMALDVSGQQRRLVWEKNFSSATTTAFRDGVFYVGLLNGEVVALQAPSGKKLWQVQTGEALQALTTGETALYTSGTNGRITAIRNKDGLLLWHDDVEGSLAHAPLLFDKRLYFATGLKVLYGYKIL
jgi:outer membrane protein assembly factor BamB